MGSTKGGSSKLMKMATGSFIRSGGTQSIRSFTTTYSVSEKNAYKLVIVGGGTGGLTMAAKLRSKVGASQVAVIEPSDVHYYQPFWTLVGGGIKDFESSKRSMATVLPKNVQWIKDSVSSFDPSKNILCTESGSEIKYDFLIVAMGLRLAFEKIKGLPEAFQTPEVCSNYSPLTVRKTADAIKNFTRGNAVFTQPPNPIKCAGAPQKIMYLAEANLKKFGKRANANIVFNTALETIFSAPKYAAALRKVAEAKGIVVNYQHNLIEVKSGSKEAVFQNLATPKKSNDISVVKYELLHITPPMVSPPVLAQSSLADKSGFLDVDKFSLQHKKYPNVFGIGDCTNIPTSKTAAAVAAQCGILSKNIKAAMDGKELLAKYDGYTSCPLVTGNKKGILAEFDFDLQALETLPIDQSKERYISYFLKKDMMPWLYWNLLLKGYWEGPEMLRKIFHLGMSR